MKALVLGATGHIGSAVTRELVARNWRVTAASRQPERPANLDGLDIDYVHGDALNVDQLDNWLRHQDLVVDAAAPYPLRAFTRDDARARARARTSDLLAAVGSNNVRLAYVSSFTTLPAERGGLDAIQAKAARAVSSYFKVKQEIEDAVLAAARIGLPAVIVNPTMCLGPWDVKARPLCLVPELLRGSIPVSINHTVNIIDVREVAFGLIEAVTRGIYGEPIRLCGHNTDLSALYRRVCEMGGAEPPALRAPAPIGIAAAVATEAIQSATGSATVYPSLAALLVGQFYQMAPERRQLELGVRLRSLSATIADSIDWYRQLGYC